MPITKTARTKTSTDCELFGHDWHRPTKKNGNKSGHKRCWRCGRVKRSQFKKGVVT